MFATHCMTKELAPRGGFEPPTFQLTAEMIENLSALSGVAYEKLGAIFPHLVAPTSAPTVGYESTCFASTSPRSNDSIPLLRFLMFLTTWGVCFSLPRNSPVLRCGSLDNLKSQLGSFPLELFDL